MEKRIELPKFDFWALTLLLIFSLRSQAQSLKIKKHIAFTFHPYTFESISQDHTVGNEIIYDLRWDSERGTTVKI